MVEEINFNIINREVSETIADYIHWNKWGMLNAKDVQIISKIVNARVPFIWDNSLLFIKSGNKIYCCLSRKFDYVHFSRIFLDEMFIDGGSTKSWGLVVGSLQCKSIVIDERYNKIDLVELVKPAIEEFKGCLNSGEYIMRGTATKNILYLEFKQINSREVNNEI